MTELHWTYNGMRRVNALIFAAFVHHGYKTGMLPRTIAEEMGVSKERVCHVASLYGFARGPYLRGPIATDEGMKRGHIRTAQTKRAKTVPITLPGPDWTKRA